MSESPPPKKGCLARLMMLVLLICSAGLAFALYLVSQPQDLSDIGGYGGNGGVQRRDMDAVLRNSLQRGYPVGLSEEQLNGWLHQTLKFEQGGFLQNQVTLEGVWVRLEETHAEVVLERRIFGHPFTVSMFLNIDATTGELKLDGGAYHKDFPRPLRGGRFGKLVVPQGFLLLVLPSYERLADTLATERSWLEKMAAVKIDDGRLTLQPRPDGEDPDLMPESF